MTQAWRRKMRRLDRLLNCGKSSKDFKEAHRKAKLPAGWLFEILEQHTEEELGLGRVFAIMDLQMRFAGFTGQCDVCAEFISDEGEEFKWYEDAGSKRRAWNFCSAVCLNDWVNGLPFERAAPDLVWGNRRNLKGELNGLGSNFPWLSMCDNTDGVGEKIEGASSGLEILDEDSVVYCSTVEQSEIGGMSVREGSDDDI